MSERKSPVIKPAVAGMPISAREYNMLVSSVVGSTPLIQKRSDHLPIKNRPFEPFVKKEDGAYKISFGAAYFIYCNVSEPTEALEIEGIDYENTFSRQWHTIEDGQVVYVECEFDETGGVNSTPRIKIGDQGETEEHYIPESGYQKGADGKKLWNIGQFQDGTLRGKILGNHIVYFPHRPAFRNLVGEENPKEHGIMQEWVRESDIYELRALKQLDAEGVPIIKDAEFGEGGLPSDTIDFRTVSSYNPETIAVAENGDTIEIQWIPSASGSLTVEDCDGESTTLLEWNNGLITSGSMTFVAGCGGTGTPQTETPP